MEILTFLKKKSKKMAVAKRKIRGAGEKAAFICLFPESRGNRRRKKVCTFFSLLYIVL